MRGAHVSGNVHQFTERRAQVTPLTRSGIRRPYDDDLCSVKQQWQARGKRSRTCFHSNRSTDEHAIQMHQLTMPAYDRR